MASPSPSPTPPPRSETPSQKHFASDLTPPDEAKLKAAVASEQGDVYLLQWLAKVEKALAAADEVSKVLPHL